jgi:hypothetical protein
MKIHTIKNRWFLPVLSCAALAMTSHNQAAILVTFEQVGDDVVATWTGSIDGGVWSGYGQFSSNPTGYRVNNNALYGVTGGNDYFDGGSVINLGLIGTITSYTGSGGFSGDTLYMNRAEGAMKPVSSVYDMSALNISQTFGNQTLDAIGADSFDATLAWTSSVAGTNTISFTTVPEPSSTALVGLGALALAVRRRR